MRFSSDISLSLWKMWCRCVIPFFFQVANSRGEFFCVKFGLFQIGVYLQGVNVDLKSLFIFHQAVRAVEIAGFLNVQCNFKDVLRNGRSDIKMGFHCACSSSVHE